MITIIYAMFILHQRKEIAIFKFARYIQIWWGFNSFVSISTEKKMNFWQYKFVVFFKCTNFVSDLDLICISITKWSVFKNLENPTFKLHCECRQKTKINYIFYDHVFKFFLDSFEHVTVIARQRMSVRVRVFSYWPGQGSLSWM